MHIPALRGLREEDLVSSKSGLYRETKKPGAGEMAQQGLKPWLVACYVDQAQRPTYLFLAQTFNILKLIMSQMQCK